MNWRRSATGNWVAYDGKNRYVIDSLACYLNNKPCRRYRLRVNASAVGGAAPKLFKSVSSAKKYADGMAKGEGHAD